MLEKEVNKFGNDRSCERYSKRELMRLTCKDEEEEGTVAKKI